jgi:hypothetical protein
MITKSQFLAFIGALERILAIAVLGCTIVYAVMGIPSLFQLDWTTTDSYFRALEFILYIVIGVELARLLIDYSLETLVELLAFVIARKLLIPTYEPFEVLILACVLFLFFAMRGLFIKDADDAVGRALP